MIFKCKMCGGDIEVIKDSNIAKCKYCKSIMTLPNLENEKILNLYNRANDYRLENEFDKAYGVYETILEIDNKQVEAHWGLLLCKYGVEYVDDPKTGMKIPTCHRTIPTSILKDVEFSIIKKEAYGEALEIYKKEAETIDKIQKGILEISSKEKPYDIFICYKETDNDNNRTNDSVIAEDIYDKLIEKGYKVFFSKITLENKLGTEYEPYIYSALNSAKVMLVVGTSEENFNAVWVKNEWSRFLEMMKRDKSKVLIPVYSKVEVYKLPEEFVRFQAQSFDKIGAMQDLIRGIDKLFNEKNNNLANEDIEKVKQAMEEASNLGNGKYEVAVMKDKLSRYYVFFLISCCLIAIGIRTNNIYNFKHNLRMAFQYRTLKDPYLYVILLILILHILPIILLSISLIMILSSKRKQYRNSKYLILSSILIDILAIIIMLKFYRLKNVLSRTTVSLVAPQLLSLVLEVLLLFINPKWHIDSSSKVVIDKVDKDKIQEKNDNILKNFKEKEKIIINKKIYIIFAVIIIAFILIPFQIKQTNERNENKLQVKVITKNLKIRSDLSNFETIGEVHEGEIYTVIDQVDRGGMIWYKIETSYGVTGYIGDRYRYSNEYYLKKLEPKK